MHPHYRAPRALDAILSKVQPGSDEFVSEKYAEQIATTLKTWSAELRNSPQGTAALGKAMAESFLANSPIPAMQQVVRNGPALKVERVRFGTETALGRDEFLKEWRSMMSRFSKLIIADFELTSICAKSASIVGAPTPESLDTRVRFELVGTGEGFHREQRVGEWELEWGLLDSGELRLRKWSMLEEQRASSASPVFVDVTEGALAANSSYRSQLLHGSDYWRTVLDGACGIDIYGHNGVSVADMDGDGLDDLYVCQPAGLPNRLYRNRGDGTFEDITEASGLGVLENTACALFADIDNDGRQDLILVRADGPVLYLNQGGGKFREKPGAFQFANAPQGSFTGAAIADYDRDGWLDVYFCLYSYYQGADQYRYPTPYFAAENGPPNFLMRNQGDGIFRDVTRESGLDKNNTRFSFCCGWGDYNADGWPDLYVVNDFGRKNLYRNNGDGTFTDVAGEAGVEDVGAGMSVCWLDYDNDGKQDLYVANMWTSAGLRVSQQENFQQRAGGQARTFYRKHAMGNSLFRNRGDGRFENVTANSGAAVGRWSWSSDAWDFDYDGFPDIYIANGMLSGAKREDLNSFFWRQLVARSPESAKPSDDYEQGWNAVNELIRADDTWSGFERNVFYLNNRDGTFSDVSAIVGLDFIEDSRSFALADFDQDGRVEVFLKNRNAPQLRILRNTMSDLGAAIAFCLRGTKSNRDAIGAAVTVETESGHQTRMLQAGSGFLSQHSKELFFGLGERKSPVKASIRWPSGLVQQISGLPVNHRVWVEEGSQQIRSEAFRTRPALSIGRESGGVIDAETLPFTVEAWLLAPVAAPSFSLPDVTGHMHDLASQRGKTVLLHFWSAKTCGETSVEDFEKAHARWAREGLQLFVVNVDEAQKGTAERARSETQWPFPMLLASEDVLAIYNILFRCIFDRHRDLPLPTSFLIDVHGDIVKIYQGRVATEQMESDFRRLPLNARERLARALPFAAVISTDAFSRNYLSIGSTYYERGYLEQAEAAFQRAVRHDPTNAEALYGLGSVYLQQQKGSEARRSFETAVRLHAAYPGTLQKAWNNLGILAAREQRTEEAIQSFQRALQIDPDYSVALVNLGNAYRQIRNWEDAKDVLQRALAINSEDPEANYSLGMVFAQTGDTGSAYERLQRAVAARPDYPEALNNLGVLYLRTQRPDEAEKTFVESIRVAPAFDQSYLNLARLYVIEGQSQRAREILLALLKQHPGHLQAEKELKDLPQ